MKIPVVSHPRAVEGIKKAAPSSKGPGARTASAPQDRVEISSSASGNRALESVKAKIRNRYYNSEPVLEDLSEKFAKLFSA